MNIHTIVKELLGAGLTQQEIAEKITALGELTHQSTIHRIAANPDYQPKSSKVFALLSLHEELKQVS